MSKYPNPCDSCRRCDTCRDFRGCADYMKRIYTIWKQFNSYPARIYRKVKNMKREKFVYEHPDIIRQYLQKGPCAGATERKPARIHALNICCGGMRGWSG